MTIRFPDPSIGDRILKFFGKKRGLLFPKGDLDAKGIDVYAAAVKESFWTALIRPRGSQLPAGAVDYETVRKEFDEIRNGRS